MTFNVETLIREAERVHLANDKWWRDLETGTPLTSRNLGQLIMLVISELAEAMEADRRNLMDDKIPTRKGLEVEIADAFIRVLDIAGAWMRRDTRRRLLSVEQVWVFGDNVAENLLRLTKSAARIYDTSYEDRPGMLECSLFLRGVIDFAAHHGLDLEGAYEEKMAFNAVRADHKPDARKQTDGKKY